jgi:hypothetical protein
MSEYYSIEQDNLYDLVDLPDSDLKENLFKYKVF